MPRHERPVGWRAEREGRLRERIRFLCRSSLLIIDEIGYLSVGAGAGNLFFQLVNARYERGAIILTSNRGFAEWGKIVDRRKSYHIVLL
jgi:DNA replication protein DnaC